MALFSSNLLTPSSGVNTTNPFSSPSYQKNVSGIQVKPMTTTSNTSGLVQGGNQYGSLDTTKPYSGLLSTPAPASTGAIKSTSVAHPDGTTVTQTYHPPEGTVNIGTSTAPKLENADGTPYLAPGTGADTSTTTTGSGTPTGTSGSTGMLPYGNAPTATGSTQDAAQGVYNAGQQTQNESNLQKGVLQAGAVTPAETYYNNMAVTGGQLQNINTLSPYAESQFYGQPGQQLAPDEAAPDLTGRTAGTDGLASSLGNIFGSAAQLGESNAIAQQQQTLNANENALSAAQTDAGRGLTSAADVLSNTMPQQVSPTNVPYNPITGQYGNPASSAYGDGGIASVGALGAQQTQGSAIQTMVGQQTQAQALAGNLSSLISSANINPTAFTFVNGALQTGAKYLGDPNYQNFSNLVNEISSRYASILNQSGGTPTDQSTISHSIINGLASGQNIQTVLGSLDKNATDSINALKSSAGTNAVSGNFTEGQKVSTNGMDFVYKQGTGWVAQ